MIKISVALVFLLVSRIAMAAPVTIDTLTSFADKYGYTDTRETFAKDKSYSAALGLGTFSNPQAVVEAKGKGKLLKSLALSCDHCTEEKSVTTKQLNLCKTEFKKLFSHINGFEPSDKVMSSIQAPKAGKRLNLPVTPKTQKIALSTGTVPCGQDKGIRLQINFLDQ